ncbi:MAG: hypothetical protein EZS28_035211 [Streblomastix strix]|uniref:Uncharacterized protein n=1 Tax=Streblomastix strix TaxID=222440 RepID=A0A5J4UGB5_9EUKA|nr:MAG: hypothetical protein EZS28_035211 [Streblomastix strix]
MFCLCSSIYNQRSVVSLFSREYEAEDEDVDGNADKGQFYTLFYQQLGEVGIKLVYGKLDDGQDEQEDYED